VTALLHWEVDGRLAEQPVVQQGVDHGLFPCPPSVAGDSLGEQGPWTTATRRWRVPWCLGKNVVFPALGFSPEEPLLDSFPKTSVIKVPGLKQCVASATGVH
jgi:hypothetical protein